MQVAFVNPDLKISLPILTGLTSEVLTRLQAQQKTMKANARSDFILSFSATNCQSQKHDQL